MSQDELLRDDDFDTLEEAPPADAGPLGGLPRVVHHEATLASRLNRLATGMAWTAALDWLREPLGQPLTVDDPEIAWRPTGLRRMGVVAQVHWPRLSTRFALGLETPLAHAIVDRLLGFDRDEPESRLAVSPVEWGILTFVAAETLRRFTAAGPGPLGPWDLSLDRVGPDPFDVGGLGSVVTIRWPIALGGLSSAIRLWLPAALALRLASAPPLPPAEPIARAKRDPLAATWRAEAGTITLHRGLRTLRPGGVLPLIDARLSGTAKSPAGAVDLALTLSGAGGRYAFRAEPVANSGGGRLTIVAPWQFEPTPREALSVNPGEPSSDAANDVPVTLVVELGRLNLTLSRLADLKPGDVVELGRHSREPVELTSNGRLVARGELVQIDTELGVRITNVFL